MAYDFKRAFRDLYQPKAKPELVDVPAMTFAAVAGSGDPNEEGGRYQRALGLLYAFSYTVKMSKRGTWQPEGYFDYVVPPLEGLWWAGAGAFDGASIADKGALSWVSLIRQPDFVTPNVLDRVRADVAKKKPELAEALDAGELRLVRFAEGPCVQMLHVGPYDTEPETIAALSAFVASEGLAVDIAEGGALGDLDGNVPFDSGLQGRERGDRDGAVPEVRLHHELYLGDPRKTTPERLRTVIRHPVKMV